MPAHVVMYAHARTHRAPPVPAHALTHVKHEELGYLHQLPAATSVPAAAVAAAAVVAVAATVAAAAVAAVGVVVAAAAASAAAVAVGAGQAWQH